jgi:aldose 1-epimerase
MIEAAPDGRLRDGRTVTRFALRNRRGSLAELLDFGGIVRSLRPSGYGGRNVVLGYGTLADYENDPTRQGALIGRYANRIADASFVLDGRRYAVSRNREQVCLHGGFVGFDKKLWRAQPPADGSGLRLCYRSADGEEGFPGNLAVTADYALSDDDVLSLSLRATTDAPTVLNLTNHSYFNLSGAATIEDHAVALSADFFTPTDARSIPTGEIRAVDGTPFDLRGGARIRDRIDADDEQLALAGGFDHNFVVRRQRAGDLVKAARVSDPGSGRAMEVWTTEPGVQFYTGNSLGDRSGGRIAQEHARRSGLCLETQHFPDSPHRPNFPSTVLRPGDTFTSRTEWRFFGP